VTLGAPEFGGTERPEAVMSRWQVRGQSRLVIVLAAVALACWTVVAVAVFLTPPADGANIGAGMVGLLAIAVTIAAALAWKRVK
jgi:protein-S-isoprenylcysteine O-methyltransferase Ste14